MLAHMRILQLHAADGTSRIAPVYGDITGQRHADLMTRRGSCRCAAGATLTIQRRVSRRSGAVAAILSATPAAGTIGRRSFYQPRRLRRDLADFCASIAGSGVASARLTASQAERLSRYE